MGADREYLRRRYRESTPARRTLRAAAGVLVLVALVVGGAQWPIWVAATLLLLGAVLERRARPTRVSGPPPHRLR